MKIVSFAEAAHVTKMQNTVWAFNNLVRNVGMAGHYSEADVKFAMFFGSISEALAVWVFEQEIEDVRTGAYA